MGKGSTGVGIYIKRILEALFSIDQQNEYCLIANAESPLQAPNLTVHYTPFSYEAGPMNLFWEHLYLPRLIHRWKADIFYSPYFLMPWRKFNVRSIVTIHDLCVFRYPETVPGKFRLYLSACLKAAARIADLVITTSESSKRDLVEYLGITDRRISVIPAAGNGKIIQGEGAGTVSFDPKEFSISGEYLLSVGTVEPRKNYVNLLHAFDRLRKMHNIQETLVICGSPGWMAKEVVQTVNRLALQSCVRFLGYIPAVQLPSLYANAKLFVYPSLYEGFGIPILEAMEAGVPVVCSNRASMAEVAGDAAILVDPQNIEDLAGGILKGLKDEKLRNQLTERSRKRSLQFSWEQSARKFLQEIDKVGI